MSMNRDEHKQIIEFIEHATAGSVVDGGPVDIEADAIIRALFVRNPDAAYRVTMLAMNQARELGRMRTQPESMAAPARKGLIARMFGFARFFHRHVGQGTPQQF
ncbi:MAG: hypothetical protein P4L54_07240 [Acidocella sp.]|nr:hypothetical protein [Acidocella sp.]